MKAYITRKTGIGMRANSVDPFFSPELTAAALTGSTLSTRPDATTIAPAIASWPLPYSQILATAGLQVFPGIYLVNTSGQCVPFRVNSIVSGIAEQFTVKDIDLGPVLRSLPPFVPPVSDPNREGNRFSVTYQFDTGNSVPLMSKGTLSQQNGGNVNNQKVLTSPGRVSGFSFSQTDELTLFQADPLVYGVDIGYDIVYPANKDQIKLAVNTINLVSDEVVQRAALTSMIEIDVQGPFQDYWKNASTDLYLVITENITTGLQIEADKAAISTRAKNYTLDKGPGTMQVHIIPMNALESLRHDSIVPLPTANLDASLFIEEPSARTNFGSFISESFISKKLETLTLLNPVAPPNVWA